MTPFAKFNFAEGHAFVVGLTIVVIASLEGYALSQGVDGTALTASLAYIAGLGGASIGRLLR